MVEWNPIVGPGKQMWVGVTNIQGEKKKMSLNKRWVNGLIS